MSAPTEATGLVPNVDRGPRERSGIRPHGTGPAPAVSAATAASRARPAWPPRTDAPRLAGRGRPCTARAI